MAKDEAQEKTEEATPHRMRKSRDDGQVAKSMELSSVAIVGLGFMSMIALGPMVVDKMKEFMTHTFVTAPSTSVTAGSFVTIFRDSVVSFFLTIGPFMLSMIVIGVLINISQVGVRFTTKPLEPKLDKLDPIAGLKRVFSGKVVVEYLRDVVKVLLVAYVAYVIITDDVMNFFELMDSPTERFAQQFGSLALLLALKIVASLLTLAVFDFAFQRFQHKKKMRMTKQEVRDESKDTDGNPVLKGRIRQAQRELAQRRMMQDVQTADVVVTNPTHYAVALKYDKTSMEAPTVVAKGQRLIAQRIKEIAREAGVPVIENKPLARSLFKVCEIGAPIPAKLYKAVAEVLAHVYQLKGKEV
jgi:flagellar biosynthesis protein FlhB